MDSCTFPLCKYPESRGGFCLHHAKHFAGEKIKAPVKKIPIKSVKRIVEEKLYKKVKKEYLTAHLKCEVKGCNKVSKDLHHMRGRIGKLLYNEKYFLAVCRDHHTEIELNPVAAKENGYSLSRLIAHLDKETEAIIIEKA